MSQDINIHQEITNSQNVTVIGYQELHLVPIPRVWKRPNEADPLRRWVGAVGRRAELDSLKDRLVGEHSAAITAAVAGMAGVGKSTLASMFVQEHAGAYPGGVLWAELGVTFNVDRCGEILERWACYAYEGDFQIVTQTLRQQNYQLTPEAVRALLSGQGRLLVVLDDIWDYAAAEPLLRALPPDARLIATTRDVRIADEFGRQDLDVLTSADALTLLRQDLSDLPDDLLTRLAEGLGCHAQALRIAVGDVKRRGDRARREKAVADLLVRVREGTGFGGLPPLDQVNRQDKVEAALKFSYDDIGTAMGEDYQRRFRQLGAFAPPEADFGTEAAAELWGDNDDTAAEFLDVLRDRNLITQAAEGRWRQHALLRAYALALLKRAGEEADARARHLEFYGAWGDYWIGQYEVMPLEPDLDQYRHAFAWAKDNTPEQLVSFVDSSWQFLLLMNHYADLRLWLSTALEVAGEHEDFRAQGYMLVGLGKLSRFTGDPAAARTCYDRALLLFEQMDDLQGQANTLMSLGDMNLRNGDLTAARMNLDRALSLFEQGDNLLGQANTLLSLGLLSLRTSEPTTARSYYERALPLFEQVGDSLGQANTLKSLGDLSRVIGELAASRTELDRALALFEQVGDQLGQASTLRSLGDLNLRTGDPDAAHALYDRALSLFEQIDNLREQAITLKSMGDLSVKTGDPDASTFYNRALPLFEQVGDLQGQANLLAELGDLSVETGEHTAAHSYYDRALPLYEQVGHFLAQIATLESIGDLFQAEGQSEQAVAAYERSIALTEQIRDGYTRAILQVSMAATLVKLGRIEQALAGLLEAQAFFQENGHEGILEPMPDILRSLKAEVDGAAFDAAWQAVVGEPQPDWLQDLESDE